MMMVTDIRSKSIGELVPLAKEMRSELARLRIKKNLGVTEAAAKIASTRKTIARIETIIKEKSRIGDVNE